MDHCREAAWFKILYGNWPRDGFMLPIRRPQRPPENRSSSWLGSARDIAIAGAIGAVAIGAIYLVSRVS